METISGRRSDTFEAKLALANEGIREAQREVGLIYLNGDEPIGVRNEVSGIDWLRRAAEQGDITAQRTLARHCGEHSPTGRAWLREAAMRGDSEAMLLLGESLSNEEEHVEALAWVSLAEARLASGSGQWVGKIEPKLSSDEQREAAALTLAISQRLQSDEDTYL